MSALSLVTKEASIEGTSRSRFFVSLTWKAAAISTSLPLISGLAKVSFMPLSVEGRRSNELVRWNTEPAVKFLGGATGVTSTTRLRLSTRTTRSSSGSLEAAPILPRKATVPTPEIFMPEPDIGPVTMPSRKGISAACTEPAAARST